MNSNSKMYDVAISFLRQDEHIAIEIWSHLNEVLSVFIYSKRQEELAGNEGLEEFRATFRDDCRLIVVLYRDGWGQTPWTRVEETAIKEKCLADGWGVLLFVTLDNQCNVPKWVPETYLRMHFAEYGMEQLIGAIKLRVQEVGGTPRHIDALARAKIEQEEAEFQTKRRNFLDSSEGGTSIRGEVTKLFNEIEQRANQIISSTSWRFKIGFDNQHLVLVADTVSMGIYFRMHYANRAGEARLIIHEIQGSVLMPGQRGFYAFGEPRILNEITIEPDVVRGLAWRWLQRGSPQFLRTSEELADYCLQAFLRLMGRSVRGDLPQWS
jgi:hypothetical protein